MVWAFDRMARSVRHFFEVLDEITRLNIDVPVRMYGVRRVLFL
jgi:DNA invertase Pin-like site-specific DNA recombinase